MKLASIFVPTYLPRPYPGATPVPYQSGTVDKFERQLVELLNLAGPTPFLVRGAPITRLHPDSAGRFAHPQPLVEYMLKVDPEMDTLGEAIALTLRTFTLEAVSVIFDGEELDFDIAAAAALTDGIHPWNGEA